jgi:hypothetical protein
MSQQITTAHVQSYGSNVIALYQQSEAKLQGAVKEEPMKAKMHFFDRLGATAAVLKTVRHGATPIVDSLHSRRAVVMADYEWADLVDQQDEIRILIDPKSQYAINAVKALKRTYDDVVIAAFDANALAGENGTDTVVFTDEDAGDVDFSAAVMDIDDLLTLKQLLDEQEVPADGRFILVAPSVLSQLLRDVEVSSADFNSIKTLVRGEIDTYLGFKFITSNRLPTVAGTDKYGFAWHKESMGVAMGMPIKTNISVRDDLSYATQVYAAMTLGAVRLQGSGVVRYRFDDNL